MIKSTPTKSTPAEDSRSNSKENSTLNDAAFDPKVLDAIGGALKAHYDDLTCAPLPSKLLDLLARLEAEERREEPQEKPDTSG